MIQFISHKIRNKKVLNSSLLVGVILLAGFLCIYPMFRNGSLNRLLQTNFVEYAEKKQVFPAVLSRNGETDVKLDGNSENLYSDMKKYEASWNKYLDIPVVQQQEMIETRGGIAMTTFNNTSRLLNFASAKNFYDYVDVLSGVSAEEAEKSDNERVKEALKKGAYPCVISQIVMDRYDLIVGETLSFKSEYGESDSYIDFVITGIVEEKQEDNYYWYVRLADYKDHIFISQDCFYEIMQKRDTKRIKYNLSIAYNYTDINLANADRIWDDIKQFRAKDKTFACNFQGILKEYVNQRQSITVILFTFELPIVALLLAFLYMISSRILEMETMEIAMLKSRGASRKKIINIYVTQSSIISLVGSLVGLPVGYVMCKLAAGTNSFLSFSLKDVSIYKATPSMLLFSLLAFALGVLFMTLPVLGLSKLTITDRKNMKVTSGKKAFWQKFFVDIVLLALSVYLLYNYKKQSDVMAIDIISGKSVDPVVFLNSTLFIFAAGLLCLRLLGYLVRAIYRIRRKKWKPASYMAFLQTIRGARKQGFITVFLIMTISMGIFNAALARTVNENMERRTSYNVGTDMRVAEQWKMVRVKLPSGEVLWHYNEPDFTRYNFLEGYGVEKKTKVLIDTNIDITANNKTERGNTLMGIHTKEFGEIAELDPNLNDQHWYYYLNQLAQNPNGVIISSNLAKLHSVKVGDTIKYERYSPVDGASVYTKVGAKVCGIVDSFPGFESTSYITDENGKIVEKENYLIVANYATVVNNCSLTPYEVWMKTSDSVDTETIANAVREKGIDLVSIQGMNDQIQTKRNTAMIQITNGMFSIGFIISLLICATGFMIYWILTIKEREMHYGIYRAMGMSMKEITRMLVIEQVFSSLMAVIASFGVGIVATYSFTNVIARVYLPEKHNLPLQIFYKPEDIIKITVILIVAFALCFMAMRRTLKKMNITKALKMGDD